MFEINMNVFSEKYGIGKILQWVDVTKIIAIIQFKEYVGVNNINEFQ